MYIDDFCVVKAIAIFIKLLFQEIGVYLEIFLAERIFQFFSDNLKGIRWTHTHLHLKNP